MASRPVMLLGNLASMIVAIAGILQALSWTIAGATILAILSITTFAPTRASASRAGAVHSTTKKTGHSTTTETKSTRERTQEKQSTKQHQTPGRLEQREDLNEELARASPLSRVEGMKTAPPKITPPRTIPSSASPAQPGPSRPSMKQESLKPIPSIPTSTVGTVIKPPPQRIDPNARQISRGDYATYDVELNQRTEVTCDVSATGLVNAYLLDEDNLNSLDLGEEFWSESGEEGVQKATLHFVAPQNGKWILVIENADNKDLSATANIRKAPARSPRPS